MLVALLFATLVLRAEPSAAALAGKWRLVPDRSTEPGGWKTIELVITADGSRVTLARKLSSGRRSYDDTAVLDLSRPENVVPTPWFADNRHLAAFMGADKTRRVRTELLDGGRRLRTSADLTVETQQGLHALNILTDYQISESGAVLTLIELRSTRSRPIVYVFTRATAVEAKP